ncbi:MAG: nucleoside deaminase [Minisyncoccota bacterium]
MILPNEKLMRVAIEAAKESARKGDYGIGSVVTHEDVVIAIGFETLKSANDPVNGHAEIDAIRKACQALQKPYLEECVLYSTHEPCPMCASAAIWAKMKGIVFAVSREDMKNEMKKRMGGAFSWRQIDIPCKAILEKGMPTLELIGGFLREEGLTLFEDTK